MLRPESLAPHAADRRRRDAGESTYTLDVWGTCACSSRPASPSCASATTCVRSPSRRASQDGQLLVPLQLVSDVFPDVVPNARWDAESVAARAVRRMRRARGRAPRREPACRRAPRACRVSASAAGRRRRLPPVPAKRHRRTIIVDAGHGGVDNGMTGPLGGGPRIYEKNITLAVAKKLGDAARSRAASTSSTRARRDTLIALDDRGRIANRADGNLFISIHVNAANPNWKDPRGSRGFETYFLVRGEDRRRAPRRADGKRRRSDSSSRRQVDSGDPLSFILSDMQQNEHLRESSELAEIIQQRLGRMHPGSEPRREAGGLPRARDGVHAGGAGRDRLRHQPGRGGVSSRMPAKQDAIAAAIADAAHAIPRRYEGRVEERRHGRAHRGDDRRAASHGRRQRSSFRILSFSPPAPRATGGARRA